MRVSLCLLCQGLGEGGLGPQWGLQRQCCSVALGHPESISPGLHFPCKGRVSRSGTVETPQGWQRPVLNPTASLGELRAGPRERTVQPQAPCSCRGLHIPAAMVTRGCWWHRGHPGKRAGLGEAGNPSISVLPVEIAANQKAPSPEPCSGPRTSAPQCDAEDHHRKSSPVISQQRK